MMFIPVYKNLVEDLDDLKSRGYQIARIELSSLTILLISGREIPLTNADKPAKTDGELLFGFLIQRNEDLLAGQYRIVTEEQVDYVLREDPQR